MLRSSKKSSTGPIRLRSDVWPMDLASIAAAAACAATGASACPPRAVARFTAVPTQRPSLCTAAVVQAGMKRREVRLFEALDREPLVASRRALGGLADEEHRVPDPIDDRRVAASAASTAEPKRATRSAAAWSPCAS